MEKNLPKYMIEIIKKFPKIMHGRKNIMQHHSRIMKNLLLSEKYHNKKSKN